jgi:transposase InsO family protein
MACKQWKPPTGLMHHSDWGNQYVSSAYQAKLKRAENTVVDATMLTL